MAYGFGKQYDAETILAFDLGGGTFDVSVLESFEGIMEVIATGGDSFLGGDDFAGALCEHILSQRLGSDTAAEIRGNPISRAALLDAVEQAKVALSNADAAEVSVPSLNVQVSVSRDEFEAATAALQRRLAPALASVASESKTALAVPLDSLLEQTKGSSSSTGQGTSHSASPLPSSAGDGQQAGASTSSAVDKYAPKPRQITAVVLVGGATRMPNIQHFLHRVTGLEPCTGVDPELCVALGAAIQAGVFMGVANGLELMDGSYVADLHGKAAGFQV